MTEAEKAICKLYLEELDKHHTCNEYRLLMQMLEQEPCDDAISRQAVLELAEWFDLNLQHFSVANLIDEVENMPPVNPQEQKTKWIPCIERLPEADEYIGNVAKYYLVQNEYGDILVARYKHSGYWEQIYQLKPIGDEIVAWMPLPEQYKAESEG